MKGVILYFLTVVPHCYFRQLQVIVEMNNESIALRVCIYTANKNRQIRVKMCNASSKIPILTDR